MATVVKPQADHKGEMLNVLLIEDDHNDYVTLVNALRRHEYERFNISRVSRIDDAIEMIANERYDLVISDLNLPDSISTNTIYKLGSVVKFISTIEELRRSGGRLEILMPFFQSGRIAAYNA